MFKRVLLIAPPSSSYLGALAPPSNLGYLAQSLYEAGIEYTVEDLRGTRTLTPLRRRLHAFKPDLIGVGIVSKEYLRSYNLVREIKKLAPQAAVVAGGPHVSALKTDVLEACPGIDFGIVQEGERSLVQLCKGESSFEEIPGLLYRSNGAVLAGAPPQFIKDLDSIPFPRYINFNLARYVKAIPIITSRGCPYECIFCFHGIMGDKFRPRSPANVVDEIEHWYERGFRQIIIDDDNFTLQNRRVYAICDEIEQRGLKGLFIRCSNGIRADRVDRDLLQRLKEVGVREVGFGADGGNDRVLMEVVKKGETLETIERAIRNAVDVGLEVRLFIILGHPGETMSDIEDSLALARRYPLIRLHLNNPIPYPGTELYEWVQANNRFLVAPEKYLNNLVETDDEPVFDTPELPVEDRRQIYKKASKIEMDVWREATERMLDRLPALPRKVVGRIFATDFGQWLFFKNRLSRSFINTVWYRRVMRGTA